MPNTITFVNQMAPPVSNNLVALSWARPLRRATIRRPADPALAKVITAINMMLTTRSCGLCRVIRFG